MCMFIKILYSENIEEQEEENINNMLSQGRHPICTLVWFPSLLLRSEYFFPRLYLFTRVLPRSYCYCCCCRRPTCTYIYAKDRLVMTAVPEITK